MIRSIQPVVQSKVSFSPGKLQIESASERFARLLMLEHVGTPVNQDVLLRAEEAARQEARQDT